MKKAQRVHILTSVNASAVSKSGDTYTIRGVCGAVDNIVMNGVLYPAEQLAAGVATLEGKPAPAGHPKNAAGQNISALNGEALASAWIGSFCTNARHEGGRTLVDIVVNGKQARAHEVGAKLVDRLEQAITGANMDPIHVSTGLYHEAITANGESGGKAYSRIAVNLKYDHLAILVDGTGAGTPAEGVGMFLNEKGEQEEISEFTLNTDPIDHRGAGLLAKAVGRLRQLLGNGKADPSFDEITSALYGQLPEGAWLRDVFERYAIWTDREGKFWQQDYSLASDGSVAFSGQAVEVARKVSYEPIATNQETDTVKEKILAALNAAGIKTEGLDEGQLLTAYNSLVIAPVEQKLTAANSTIAGYEAAAQAAQNAERDTLAAELATNSALTADDLKALPLARLKEIKATRQGAAPVLASNTAKPAGSEFAGYDMNSILKEGK